MKFILSFALVLFSIASQARSLYCEIKINNAVVAKGKLEIQSQQKIQLTRLQSASFYISEKPNDFFSIEAFLPAYEARIYGEGNLRKAGDRVSVSMWSRESLIEAACVQLN